MDVNLEKWHKCQIDKEVLNKLSKKSVFNFGDQNWTARQSLNQLISVIADGYSPSNVIFYDGVKQVRLFEGTGRNEFDADEFVRILE